MFICIKEHLSNICSLIHEKLSNTEAELKKVLRLKKKFYEFPELVLILKAHSKVWDNFWYLKALQKWWALLFILPFYFTLSFCHDFLVM